MKETYIVVTIRGWDGNRILGVFSSEEAARAARDEIVSTSPVTTKEHLRDQEFIFDFVELNKSSCGSSMIVNSSSLEPDCTFRNHLYNSG